MAIVISDHSDLMNFFAGRLHNMWPEEYGTWENAIHDICQKKSVSYLTTVQDKLKKVIESKYDEDSLADIVNEKFSANIYPPGMDLTYQKWLEIVNEMVSEWIQKKETH